MLHTRTTPKIQVQILHQDPLICAGLCAALTHHTEFDIMAATHDHGADAGSMAVDVLVTDHANALHVLQSRSTCRQGGTNACIHGTRTRILVVTTLTGEEQIRQAVMAGVTGYVVLGGSLDAYVDAVRALGKGMRYVCRRASHELMGSVSQATLTSREREVLCPLAQGLANKAIARELGISVGTVKVHVRSILDKLQASSRTQAASVAVQRGLVDARTPLPTPARNAAPPHSAMVYESKQEAIPRSRTGTSLTEQLA